MAEGSWVQTGVRWEFHPSNRRGRRVVEAGIGERERVLAKVPLFAGLSKRHRRRVAGESGVATYDQGATVVQEGAAGSVFYVILEGRARVVRNGRTLARLNKGDFFGEMSLLDGRPRTASVVTETPSAFLTLSARSFRAVMDGEPTAASAILKEMAGRLRDLERPPVG
jgi:CRP/FNR family transcriptional regulator, cyclic AMP receptor protein